MERPVNQSRETMSAPRTLPIHATPVLPGRMAIVAILTVVILTVPGCGEDSNEVVIPDAQLLPGPPPTIEAQVRARPWAGSRWRGQAWGSVWREETHNPKDREGRGIDAYKWAIGTCDAVRNGGQTAEAMVRRVRDHGRFTEQGARVIVTAALGTLCPEASQPSP